MNTWAPSSGEGGQGQARWAGARTHRPRVGGEWHAGRLSLALSMTPADHPSPLLPPLNCACTCTCTCRRALQPLVDAGFVEIVYGGGPVGKYLCSQPAFASGVCLGRGHRQDLYSLGGWAPARDSALSVLPLTPARSAPDWQRCHPSSGRASQSVATRPSTSRWGLSSGE